MDTIIKPEDYFIHRHNKTGRNERCVELPLAFRFLDMFKGKKLYEIGAVTPYYRKPEHIVIDPTDKMASRRQFSQDIDYKGLNVLSISTIEHMGRGDYNLDVNEQLCIVELKRMYQDSLNCLITFPVGYNKILDKYVKDNRDKYNHFFYLKTGKIWNKTMDISCFDMEYSPNCVICILKIGN